MQAEAVELLEDIASTFLILIGSALTAAGVVLIFANRQVSTELRLFSSRFSLAYSFS